MAGFVRQPAKKQDFRVLQEELHGKAELIVGKQRHGPIVSIDLAFEGRFTKFSDLAKPWQGESGSEF